MANKCLRCVTGMIGATKIYEGDWEQSAALFEKKIEDWNERTRHYAIPHPGYRKRRPYHVQNNRHRQKAG